MTQYHSSIYRFFKQRYGYATTPIWIDASIFIDRLYNKIDHCACYRSICKLLGHHQRKYNANDRTETVWNVYETCHLCG